MTQPQRVLKYMNERGPITQKKANDELGVSRLSAIILELKRSGVEIKDTVVTGKDRWGNNAWWKEYWIA